ncbi:MAG: effector-associated domain EAD1-containing protein [Acidobacteriota bacterium]|nr:effector-associated domain EAD1-containing protein [Acidobacteriota bacterium]
MIKELRELGFQKTLAAIYNQPMRIQMLFTRADIPAERMPVLAVDPLTYWGIVLTELSKGVSPGGLQRLANEVAQDYPGNAVFKACNDLLAGRTHKTSGHRHLVILFITSNPHKDLSTRIDKEWREIREATAPHGNIHVLSRTAATIEELPGILAEIRPNLLHFSGHATEEGLEFETRSGQGKLVSATDMADIIRTINADGEDPVRCALFNACSGQATAEATAACTGASIGFRGPVNDDEAVAFARGFYSGLVGGLDLTGAVNLGRKQMDIEDKRGGAARVVLHTKGRRNVSDHILFPRPHSELGE